ncbi:hypothetical protein SAMD00023353_2500920 [Rosellinia necatrix]|uniref:Uncharacterized protein n=1 Tax=Rosellinia necatrix TaxID=77044 RepID=A0A1S8A861_ROSNE|nr:hypothetical protein SAMD00023353_2500920 [Rosellinia necatrix]
MAGVDFTVRVIRRRLRVWSQGKWHVDRGQGHPPTDRIVGSPCNKPCVIIYPRRLGTGAGSTYIRISRAADTPPSRNHYIQRSGETCEKGRNLERISRETASDRDSPPIERSSVEIPEEGPSVA